MGVGAGSDPGSPHTLTSSQIPKAEPQINSGDDIIGTILETQETFTHTHTHRPWQNTRKPHTHRMEWEHREVYVVWLRGREGKRLREVSRR